MGIFETGTIWATSIHSLNDSREFSHAVDVGKSAIERWLAVCNHPNARALLEPMAASLDSVSKAAVYVACFSAVSDSLSQWRGYCPPGFGYSIGIDGDELRGIAGKQGFTLDQCIYDHAAQRAKADQWAKRAIDDVLLGLDEATDLTSHVRQKASRFQSEFRSFAPFLKDSSFRDEREWRLSGLVRHDDPRLRVRAGRSMLVRYLPIDLQLSKSSSLLWNVRVGPTPHPELAMNAVGHYINKVQLPNGVERSHSPYRDW